jgi:hypothetical protein
MAAGEALETSPQRAARAVGDGPGPEGLRQVGASTDRTTLPRDPESRCGVELTREDILRDMSFDRVALLQGIGVCQSAR